MFVYRYANRFSNGTIKVFIAALIIVFLVATYGIATIIAEKNHDAWLIQEYGTTLEQRQAIDEVGKVLMKDPSANVFLPKYVIDVNRSDIAGKRYVFIGCKDLFYYGTPAEYSVDKIESTSQFYDD